MLKVGITGGIGSGKTIVCQVFEKLQVPVYYSDQVSRDLLASSKNLAAKVIENFGTGICGDNGIIDRRKLAEKVFGDQKSLALLNSLIHPVVNQDFSVWITQQKDCPYIVKEAAILFESGAYKDMDYVISVFADLDVRECRVAKRDGVTHEQFIRRTENQLDEETKCQRADYVIDNNGNLAILPQVLKFHEAFISKTNT
jgi:dephospho-CoA kinase